MRKFLSLPLLALCLFPFSVLAAPEAGEAAAYSLYLKGDLSKAAGAYLALAPANPGSPEPLLNAAMIKDLDGRGSS